MWSSSVQTGAELSIAGMSAKNLAKEFGTPAFFIDQADFYARATEWNTALKESFGANAGTVYYAAKAFICTEVARWIKDVGIGIDVCTGGELSVALAGGIDPAKIELHGNNKSVAEIEKAVTSGVGTIVLDSLYEIERVEMLQMRKNRSYEERLPCQNRRHSRTRRRRNSSEILVTVYSSTIKCKGWK